MRRPIASREKTWAKNFARFLAARGVRPNFVSGLSVVFALGAFFCFFATRFEYSKLSQIALWLGAALCVQMRLLCNLFDGMLAVEFDQKSVLGPIYNDFPDRPADVLILVGASYALSLWHWTPTLGWIASALALLTAYVRVLGAAIGAEERFTGPMAKQHRMAVVTFACVLAAIETSIGQFHRAIAVALGIICVGCVLTIARRLQLMTRDLNDAQSNP